MDSLVLELQRDACSPEIKATDLLRKAYVVAKKLKVQKFEEWIDSELNGFTCGYGEIPEYRKLTGGRLRGWNPVNGWIPVLIDDDKLAELTQNRIYNASLSSLESLINEGDGSFAMQFGNENRKLLSEWIGFETEFRTFYGKSHGVIIVDAVRNAVLEWSLKLEEEGILGEGMRFTAEEKVKAQAATNIFISGNGATTQVQVGTNASTQNMALNEEKKKQAEELIGKIEENLSELDILPENVVAVEALVRDIKDELSKNQPRTSFLKEVFGGIRRILEGVGGSVLAAGLIHMINAF